MLLIDWLTQWQTAGIARVTKLHNLDDFKSLYSKIFWKYEIDNNTEITLTISNYFCWFSRPSGHSSRRTSDSRWVCRHTLGSWSTWSCCRGGRGWCRWRRRSRTCWTRTSGTGRTASRRSRTGSPRRWFQRVWQDVPEEPTLLNLLTGFLETNVGMNRWLLISDLSYLTSYKDPDILLLLDVRITSCPIIAIVYHSERKLGL